MQQPQKRLGRGLKSLLSVEEPVSDAAPAGEASPAGAPNTQTTLAVDRLRPNPFQPRRDMPPAELKALADSIRKSGVIQPILVRQAGDGQYYEIIAGERRWRAAQQAGMAEVPVVLRTADDREMLELALVENIFREDLNAIDRALAYRRYCDEFQISAEEVAQRLGEDRTTVTNYLRLLDLPIDVRQWVAEGKLAMGHARALLGLKSASEITQLARQVMEQGLSVRAVEKLVRERADVRARAVRDSADQRDSKRAHVRNLEESFTRALGTKVEIQEAARKGRGKLVIHYFSLDDFDRIMERLGVDGDSRR